MITDTSDLVQHLEAMGLDSSSELELYQSLFANAPIAMAISTPEGRFVHVNSALCDLLGYSKQEILSGDIVITHPDELNVNKYIQNYIKNPTIPSLSVEKRYLHKSGRVIFGLLNIAPFRDPHGKVIRLVVQIVDLSERHELETRNRYLAYTDPITNLPNRRAVFEHLRSVLEVKTTRRNPAFIYLDLDRFKVINDTFGHQVGDLLLAEIGAKLRQVIFEQHYVGRIGGDEFGIVITDSSKTDLQQLALHIRQAMRIPVRAKNLELPVDVSVGAAVYPKGGVTADELITNADIAMYHAKRHHVDFQFYTEDINEYSERLFVQESKLRQAISQQDFYLDLEHACYINGGALRFYEGLLRWKQDNEIVAPYHFVPIAESTGLIRKLDSIALQLASQLDYKSMVPTVAINLSRLSLLDSSIVDEISTCLSEYTLDPKNLIVEVTETVAVSDTEKIADTLNHIKDLGLLIALDDFGTGFTSFSMLKQLPLDVLKVDKSLIKGIGRSAVDEKIIIATISIGHELGLEVVAEGVETEQQLDWLGTHHCDMAQGWHITSTQSL